MTTQNKTILRALAGETQPVPPIWMMRQAALWAVEQGAQELAVLCTTANNAANGLYKSLGFSAKGHYHYRQM